MKARILAVVALAVKPEQGQIQEIIETFAHPRHAAPHSYMAR